jgi:hypothetical protein
MNKLYPKQACASASKQTSKKMKTKLVIIGLDRVGKTTVGRLLGLLSFGRIKFADTSNRAWEAESLSKEVRELAKKLQKDRLLGGEVGQEARRELVRLYDEWGVHIFHNIMQEADMYIGLRDMEVLAMMRREYRLRVVLVSSNFKLSRGKEVSGGFDVLGKGLEQLRQSEKYAESKPDYCVNNDGSWGWLVWQVWKLVGSLEDEGELEPVGWTGLLMAIAALAVLFSYGWFAWRYFLT